MVKALGFVTGLFGGLGLLLVMVVGGLASMSAQPTGSASVLANELRAAGVENGRLAGDLLVTVSAHGSYRCQVTSHGGAADMWLLLVSVASLDGVDVEGGWCYRDFDSQVELWASRQCFIDGMCDGDPYPPTARPGTSNHGWGLAVDVWGSTDTTLTCESPEFRWMQFNAPRLGWVHPDWAQCGRPGSEPWHWEFVGVSEIPSA